MPRIDTHRGDGHSLVVPGQAKLRGSDFRVEVEECVERPLELRFNFFAGAFDEVHRDVGLVAGGQFEGGVVNFGDFAFGEEPQSVD